MLPKKQKSEEQFFYGARRAMIGGISASATILALMFMMFGVSKEPAKTLDNTFFKGANNITLLTVILLSASTLLLLFLSIPITETNEANASHEFIYYFLTTYAAVISGIMVSVVLMLYNSVQSLISLVRPRKKHK